MDWCNVTKYVKEDIVGLVKSKIVFLPNFEF